MKKKTTENGKAGGKKKDASPLPEAEQDAPKEKKKKSPKVSLKKLFLILAVIGILGGAGYGGYYYFFSPNVYHKKPLDTVAINDDLIQFSFAYMQPVYLVLVQANDKQIMIEQEIERLENISKEFPTQKDIAATEITLWQGALQGIKLLREELEKNIEMIYVSYHVNQEKGLRLIETHEDKLITRAKDTFAAYEDLFKRLDERLNNKGIMKKLTHLF